MPGSDLHRDLSLGSNLAQDGCGDGGGGVALVGVELDDDPLVEGGSVLVLMLVSVIPHTTHSHSWGYCNAGAHVGLPCL